MVINIDTVYQKVLAIANKEQRGYITPQEFNLMADKAQLDLFNNYFHKVKTSFLKPQNQSEASDEMEMVQEKLDWLRTEKEVTSVLIANNIITPELNGKVILRLPNDLYKIATLYLTAPGGVTASGQNPSQTYDRVEVHRVDRKDLLDMKRHPLTHPSVKRPVYTVYNSNPIYLELHPTVTYQVTTHVDTTLIPNPTWDTYAISGNSSNIEGYYENVQPETWGTDIDADYLITLPGSTFRLDYYKKPTKPKWTYVIAGGKALYNPDASDSQNFSLHPSEEEPLVMRILELCGVIIERPELQQGVAIDKANTKQEQNT